MLKNKPITTAVNTHYRLVSLPIPVTPEIVKVVAEVEGINEALQAGKYEITYEVGLCFEIQLVDNNVKFAIEEHMKNNVH